LFLVCFVSETGYAGEEPAEPERPAVEIISVSGSVEAYSADEGKYETAEEDMFLYAGDWIRTGSDSYAELVFDEDGRNVVRVESNTYAVFRLGQREKIELISGELFSRIDQLPPGSTFEVKTPTAVTGVRGTHWVMSVDQEGTEIEAVEGSLYTRSFGKDGRLMAEETVIPPGYMTKVRRFQRPSRPERFSRERRERLNTKGAQIKDRARDVLHKRRMLPGSFNRQDRMLNSRRKRDERRKEYRDVPPGPGDRTGMRPESRESGVFVPRRYGELREKDKPPALKGHPAKKGKKQLGPKDKPGTGRKAAGGGGRGVRRKSGGRTGQGARGGRRR